MSFTNFPNGITSLGVPTIGGSQIPVNVGKYFFVDGSKGSDNYDGLSLDTPLATFAAAITLANARIDYTADRWGNGDVIILAPGKYVEKLTALPHGCSVIGLGHDMGDGQNGVKIAPADGAPVDVGSWVNGYCQNIQFESADTTACFDADICNNTIFNHCRFVGVSGQSCAQGFTTKDADRLNLIDCEFIDVLIGFQVIYADGGDKFHDSSVKKCKMTNITNKGVYLTGPGTLLVNGTTIVDNYIQCTANSSIGIDDDSDGAIVSHNVIIVGTSGTPLDTNDDLSVNNQTTIKGGTCAILPAYA